MAQHRNLKTCEHCGAPIAQHAQVCPQCGGKNKKPIYKRVWFIALMIIIALSVIGGACSSDEPSNNAGTDKPEAAQSQQAEAPAPEAPAPEAPAAEAPAPAPEPEPEPEPQVEYMVVDSSTMMKDLEGNALKAANTYEGQYIEVTGKLSVIDSKGKYISIEPNDDGFYLTAIKCNIKNDEQRAKVADLTAGDVITVKGKVTKVGEVMGYTMDVDEIL